MKKKTLSLVLVLRLIAVAAVGGTLAYFTDNEEAVNTFTMGNVDIELTETDWVAPSNAAPGIAYDKNPVVKNIGENDAWVRVDVTLSDAVAFRTAADKYGITDLSTILVGLDKTNWISAGSETYDATNNTLTYSYYYKNTLTVGSSTEALFTAVKLPGAFNNADMAAIGASDDNFTVTIKAHAIQTSDDYNTVEEAFAAYVFEAK